MSEEKQPATSSPTAEFNRRAFFTRIGLGSLGITAIGTMAFAYEFLSPNVLYAVSYTHHPYEYSRCIHTAQCKSWASGSLRFKHVERH